MERRHSCLCVVAIVLMIAAPIGCSGSAPPDAKQTGQSAEVARASESTDPCALISQSDLAAAVGNAVIKGEHQGAGTCKWGTENRDDVSVLLIAHKKGETREPYLCDDLRKSGGNERIEGLEVATWKFSNTLGLFNSGEFEACGPKGFVSLQLNGKRDEAKIKQATLAIVQHVLRRL
jgi:hypothetical protein